MTITAKHGSAYDRGSADRYYGRSFDPHYFEGDSYQSSRINIVNPDSAEYQAYLAGWQETIESNIDRKNCFRIPRFAKNSADYDLPPHSD